MMPSSERQKVREKYKLSAAAYEKLREKVKGPEDLERESQWNEAMAQLRFGLETEPEMKKALKAQIEKDIAQQGIEAVLANPDIPKEMKQQLESGSFEVDVDSPTEDVSDQLVVKPEGNIGESIPVSKTLTESYLSQL